MLAGIYLGPALMLHFTINWLWGDETQATGNDDAGDNGSALARNRDGSVELHVFSQLCSGEWWVVRGRKLANTVT